MKENVIVGNLIPAGTGIRKYSEIKLIVAEEELKEDEEVAEEDAGEQEKQPAAEQAQS